MRKRVKRLGRVSFHEWHDESSWSFSYYVFFADGSRLRRRRRGFTSEQEAQDAADLLRVGDLESRVDELTSVEFGKFVEQVLADRARGMAIGSRRPVKRSTVAHERSPGTRTISGSLWVPLRWI